MTREQDIEALGADTANAEEGAGPVPPAAPTRLGDVQKCPVCGSAVDADAYQCPTCRNAFCFHCRARVLPGDVQLQCVNQACHYYGKLICDVCEKQIVEEQEPAVYMEPEEGFWLLLLIALLVASGVVWSQASIGWAALCLLLGFPIVGLALHLSGLNIFGRERRVEHRRSAKCYRCICCGQAVKQLSTSAIITADGRLSGSPF
jgi:hypothetical protein